MVREKATGIPFSATAQRTADRAAIADAQAAAFKPTHPGAMDPQARLFYSPLVVGDHLEVLFAAHRGGFVRRFEPCTADSRPGAVEHAAGRLPDIITTTWSGPLDHR